MLLVDVLILGGGAIGGVIAARLTQKVRRVAVVDADVDHVRLVRDPGLLLDRLGEHRRVKMEAYADSAELEDERFDFVLLTLKAPHLEGAIRPLLGVGTTFVTVSYTHLTLPTIYSV